MTEAEMRLRHLTNRAKNEILRFLQTHVSCKQPELEEHVLNFINERQNREGIPVHETKPIHGLAFILAYKELEADNQIKISRPYDVPFPMTDAETVFSLAED